MLPLLLSTKLFDVAAMAQLPTFGKHLCAPSANAGFCQKSTLHQSPATHCKLICRTDSEGEAGTTKTLQPKPCVPAPKFKSMWESLDVEEKKRPTLMWDYPPECCPKCDLVRFDELYYKPSDKCRKYQRTWWECCPRIVPKRVCHWCESLPPETQRRCREQFKRGVCSPEHEKERMEDLKKKNGNGCLRLRMPCCRAARDPPCCKAFKGPSCCERNKCPYPSFSECCQDELADLPRRPYECQCKAVAELCVVKRRGAYNKLHNIKINPCKKQEEPAQSNES